MEVYYSVDGKEVLSIKVSTQILVCEFIDEVSALVGKTDLSTAYLKGRKLNEAFLLENYLTDKDTDVVFISNDPNYDLKLLPTFDFIGKKDGDEKLDDTISKTSHHYTLDENDLSPQIRNNNFMIYTTATVDSLLKGNKIIINMNDSYQKIHDKIKELIVSFNNNDIPEDFEMHIFLPSGIPFKKDSSLADFFGITFHSWNKMYVIVTKKLGNLIDKEITEPCNCLKANQNLLSPLCESTLPGLTQIATFLGYLFHEGINSEHLMTVLATLTRFAPLITSICRLLEHYEIDGLNIISITAPLHTLFKSLLPQEIKNGVIFEYTIQTLTYLNKVHPDMFVDLRILDMDKKPSVEDQEFYDYLKKNNHQKHVIAWGGDVVKEEMKGIIMERPPEPILTDEDHDEYIFKVRKTFKPVAPLSLHYIHYPTFIRGERKNEVLLFIKEVTNKENMIEYIDPKEGKVKEISIEELAIKLHNSKKEEFLSAIDGNVVDQIIVICFDESRSMKWKLEGKNPRRPGEITRIEVASRFLKAFIDQSNALRVSSIYGLIGFNNEVKTKQELTALSSHFLDPLKEIIPNEKTSLYDALKEAQDKILAITKPDSNGNLPYPNAKLRIIVISDGSDNNSSASPSDLVNSFIQNGIIVDTVLVTTFNVEQNDEMCAMSKMTGGVCLRPKTIEEGLHIFEQEAFLNIKMRHIDPPHKIPVTKDGLEMKKGEFKGNYDTEIKNQTIFLAEEKIYLTSPLYMCLLYQTERDIKTMRCRRAIKELNFIGNNPNDNYVVYSSYSTPEEWRIFIKGPKKNFNEKWLNIFMSLSSLYPTVPPSFIFLTKPFHPNVSREGIIKFSLIDKNYSPKVTIDAMIKGIIDLLENPEKDSILNKEAARLFESDKKKYDEKQSHENIGEDNYLDFLKDVTVYDELPEKTETDEIVPGLLVTNNHPDERKLVDDDDFYGFDSS